MSSRLDQDAEHLHLLSIFHYIVGGLQAMFGCFPIVHFVIGALIVFRPTMSGEAGDNAGAMVGGVLFMFVAGAAILTAWTLAACTIVAGRSIARRTRYVFCLVVAGVDAAFCMPFGTILGVFTIIVLVRPSVKELFGQTPPSSGDDALTRA